MKNIFYFFTTLLFVNFSFSQNPNVILQVNGKILNGEISNLYLQFGQGKDVKRIPIDYYPGDLILNELALSFITSDTINKFHLHFDYNTFKKDDHQIANFDIELNQRILKQPYLIIDVFDFRDKNYKHWYQYITKENYLPQLIYPNSGIYIRMK